MKATSTRTPLGDLQRKLTIGYALTLGMILLLLGGGLYLLIHDQLSNQLDESLREATSEIQRAAHIREMETKNAKGTVIDAVEELHIPDRTLFLLDSTGAALSPNQPTARIRAAALRARNGVVHEEIELPHEHILSLRAEPFRLESGQLVIAIATADQIELADRYSRLIAAFSGMAAFAVVLCTIAGYFFLRQAITPAERSLAYTKRFVADAAHELRTPIAVLRTKAEVALQAQRTAGQYQETLQQIDRESQRLGRIVDDLLLLARADAGARPVEKKRFFLDDVVLDAVTSLHTLALAANVKLEVAEFEETAIIGDAALIRELVVILVDNAVKFTPAGGQVHVRVKASPTPMLIVEDTGIGIEADQMAHVFERFYRGDASRPRNRGSGLGLSIAQWIASAHGAGITLVPRNPSGTVATVAFDAPIGN